MLCRHCCQTLKGTQNLPQLLYSAIIRLPGQPSLNKPTLTRKQSSTHYLAQRHSLYELSVATKRQPACLTNRQAPYPSRQAPYPSCSIRYLSTDTDQINREFDLLSRDQTVYLDRIREDYETATAAVFKGRSPASERYLAKFGVLYTAYMEYIVQLQDIIECHKLLEDSDIRAIAKEEIRVLAENLKQSFNEIESEIMLTLQGKPGDILLEVQMATGGLESAMFAADLLGLYEHVALEKGCRWNVIETEVRGTEVGIAKATVEVSGDNVYNLFQYERGVHRVQRVPSTDPVGRIHTSTAIVIVTHKPDNIVVNINPDDLKIKYKRASGPGGQFVNSTDSKCDMVHIPTGIRVWSQKTRSAPQNKEDCLQKLHALLLKQEIEAVDKSQNFARKHQAGSGDRSDKIRTYNYSGNRITDHPTNTVIYPPAIKQYFASSTLFLELHHTVNAWWQLSKLADIAGSITKSSG